MTTLSNHSIVAKNDGLHQGTKQLIPFVPHVEKVTKIWSATDYKMSYQLSISKHGQLVDTVVLTHLLVPSWFALSHHCPDASLSHRERKLIEEFLEHEAADLPVHHEILLERYGWYNFDSGKIFYRKEIITREINIPVHTGKSIANVLQSESYRLKMNNCIAFLKYIDQVATGTSWILYMYSFLDILKDLFNRAGYPNEFILNLFGKSGSGKTSLIKTICSPSQTFSFRSAKRRDTILHEIASYEGHTILVDDYHPTESSTDRDRQAGLKDSLVRAVEETATFPNIIVSSEYLDGHTSMQDREIQIFLDDNLDWQLLEALAVHQKSLEDIRIAFYVQIVAHAEAVILDIASFCKRADDKRIADNQNNFRNARYGDYICCANYLFKKYFVKTYSINFDVPDIQPDITTQLNRQTRHMQIIKNLEHHGTYLIILRNMLQCKDIFDQIADYNEFIPSAQTIHINSQGVVSISPKALQRGMMLYLQTNNVPMKRIVKELQEAEALITYENERELTKKHKGKRIYIIDTDALNEYCSFFE